MKQIALFWRQGENNGFDSTSTYLSHLTELQADFSALVRMADQNTAIMVIVDQCSSFGDISISGPTQAQLKIALDFPMLFTSLGPKYHFTYNDGLHLDHFGQAWSGAYLGRALKNIFIDGLRPKPLHFSATLAGASLTLMPMSRLSGALVLDRISVLDPDGRQPSGLMWMDNGDGNAVCVSEVVTDGQTITVGLSAVPTGSGKRLYVAGYSEFNPPNIYSGIAGPMTGPRSCIRDSAPETMSIAGIESPLYNWAAHQVIPIT